MDHRLTEMLVCPVCKGPLQLRRDEASRPVDLLCAADRLAFPIRDGIPVMLESEARHLDAGSPATAQGE
ncbi:Trm112 family protein [Ideonella sp.]|uniref:Trm112 family protein n=1 Tax=Ideonella sp. TaxID=1929293 RepID=UPI0035B48A76